MRDSDDFAREMGLDKLYEEGRRLFLTGKHDEALEQFKRIYELECLFRDVAQIVEDYYSIPNDEWRKKYQIRFSRAEDET